MPTSKRAKAWHPRRTIQVRYCFYYFLSRFINKHDIYKPQTELTVLCLANYTYHIVVPDIIYLAYLVHKLTTGWNAVYCCQAIVMLVNIMPLLTWCITRCGFDLIFLIIGYNINRCHLFILNSLNYSDYK